MLIFAGIVLTLLDGCSKESSTNKSSKSVDNSINGVWELRQMTAQIGTINYTSGNAATLEFTDSTYLTSDSTNKIFIEGNHSKNGYYQIVADTSVNNSTGLLVPSGQFVNRIILNNDSTSDNIFYQITNNKLVILSGYFPTDNAVQLTYQKQ